jgi:NADH:ubiquinone oxidoreductase subunit C
MIEVARNEFLDQIKKMKAEGCRFVLIDAYDINNEKKQIALTYHFDREGELLSLKVIIADHRMPSLMNIYGKASNWCEQELAERYQIHFEGLVTKERFIFPEEPETGLPTFGNIRITKTEV